MLADAVQSCTVRTVRSTSPHFRDASLAPFPLPRSVTARIFLFDVARPAVGLNLVGRTAQQRQNQTANCSLSIVDPVQSVQVFSAPSEFVIEFLL